MTTLLDSAEAILFDLDGTLLDTARDLVRVLHLVCDEEAQDKPDPALAGRYVSHGAVGLVTLAFPDADDHTRERLRQRLVTLYEDSLVVDTHPYPGTLEMLAELDTRGIAWGIVTNKMRYLAEPIIEHFGLHTRCRTLVGGDTAARNKPHPDPILHALAELGAEPESDRQLEALLREAKDALTRPLIDDQTGKPRETWAPEKLRLLATVRFMRGNYHGAREVLELAVRAYDAMAPAVPFGAASCHAELADCRFFSEPDDPTLALASAVRAITIAPVSRAGRLLRRSVQTRMVDYFLAADEEEKAKRLLRELGTSAISDEDVSRGLAVRYGGLCESLLGRREAGGQLRKPPADLAPKLQRWIKRAIELNSDDPVTHYLAADLAFYVGDDETAAMHLRDALKKGLPPDLAGQFLQTARDMRPDSPALEALWATLAPPQPEGQPTGGSPTPPERRSPATPQDRDP